LAASSEQALILSLFPSTVWWACALRDEGKALLFSGVLKSDTLSYNRYKIATANGVQQLSVPLKGGRKQRIPLSELYIDYTHDWQRQHWGALYSAYGRAPFYEHYAPALEGLIFKGFEKLEDLNQASVAWLAREMRLAILFEEAPEEVADLTGTELPEYHQVFEDRFGFLPNLSAIDLLMNEGPYAANFLKSM
jgi:hypothetical protein